MKRLMVAVACGLLAGVAVAQDGKAVYDANCAACHQPDGAGALGLAPPLAGTLGKRLAVPEGRKYLPGIVIAGLASKMESKGVLYEGIMPNWQQFSDAELAAVLNHVLTTFNTAELPADFTPIEADELAATRAKKPTAKELRAWRAASQ
ncbi:cytochrome c [Dechloromonas sp. XY25]|uniref:Cytochrome c n=1 Tax=Dechloromonas hankyongensis TaxID=2908002 RepID=A0ABS9K7K0_9RHOO|nr:cytochrome c [Dechloromonas hankyongensis]MCG2579131.1 cytochrome c [Dechloromonas hankyongensis]